MTSHRTAIAIATALTTLVALAACGDADTQPVSRPSASPSDTPQGAPLEDGGFEPGRYRYTIQASCEEGEISFCPPDAVPPPPLTVEVTVPAGWAPLEEGSPVIARDTRDAMGVTEGPDGGALVLGWTSWLVGLNTDPCLSQAHERPDLIPGLTVADFVDAVRAQEALEVSRPVATTVGGHRAQWFRLQGPADLSGCDNWRPWDPGFFAQGPNNIWDVWVVDVDGTRVLVVSEYFPGTPQKAVSQLGEMVESISFGA